MSESTKRPNVVLIVTDQWRGDCLGMAGHPAVETPYLDHHGHQGSLFHCAYTATPSCIAARAALMTGTSQKTHGRVGYRDGITWNYPTNIAKAFGDQGYQTHCVGKMHVHPARNNFGFDSIDLHDGYTHFERNRTERDLEMIDDYLPWVRERQRHESDHFDQGTSCNAYTPHPWDKDELLHPSAWITTRGADFLRRQDPTRPFFLKLSFHRPHPPLDPPQWCYDQYLNMDLPEPVIGDWAEELFGPAYNENNPHHPPKQWSADRIKRLRAAYYGQITFIDHQINRFCELLQEYGHNGNTIFCFVSDHGDMVGDHNLYAKTVAYEGSAHVPMLFFSPGSDLIPGGVQDADHVAELRDIMPTLLDAAGLDIPDEVEGQSLMPIMRGEDAVWRDYLHGEHMVHFAGIKSMHYIVTPTFKYIWCSGTGHEQLFDLANDRDELHDLAGKPEHQAKLEALRENLITELTGREEGFVADGKLVAGRDVSPVLSHIL